MQSVPVQRRRTPSQGSVPDVPGPLPGVPGPAATFDPLRGAPPESTEELDDSGPDGPDGDWAAAVHVEEAARARASGGLLALLAAVTFACLPILGGHLIVRVASGVALVGLVLSGSWVHFRAADPGRYGPWDLRIFGAGAVLASIAVTIHLGPFSPTPLATTLGIAFFGQSRDSWAIPICLCAILGYFLPALLIVLGLTQDVGIFPATLASPWARAFMLVIVPAVLLATLQQAQVGARATERAMEDTAAQVRRTKAHEGRVADLRQEIAAILSPAPRKGFYTGQQVGAWRLGEVIGRGAMAEVYAAEHGYTRVEGAAKVVLPQFLDEPSQRARFDREVEIASQLRSPFVVQVLEVDRTPDGSPCIVLERLHGQDLAAALRQFGSFDLHTVGRMLDHVGMGLDTMHQAGIVHRDIKPGNIFRAEQPGDAERIWKILDFGVSKFADGKGTLTEGALIGTPAFMSPEQARGHEVDARTDIYSLGAVAYRALTDRNPFRARTTEGLIFQVSTSRPVRPGDVAAGIPAEIEMVLAIAMAPESWLRFTTGADLATAWALASAGRLPDELRQRAAEILARRPWRRL